MKKWSTLYIDVDYCPSDPGIRNWFCDRTRFTPKEVKSGKKLSYEDSGGLFAGTTPTSCCTHGWNSRRKRKNRWNSIIP